MAYRVETRRLLLRCWAPEDAVILRSALDESDQHLRPWIPFMKDEPRTLEQSAEWLRMHRASFDMDQNYRYAVFDRGDDSLLGENMLLSRAGPGALEVGYWTTRHAIGRGAATEASSAMIKVAFELAGAGRVEIHCAPDNEPSVAIPRKLGFTHEATLRDRAPDTEGTMHDLMIWTLFAENYPDSVASNMDVTAYDCLGRKIL